MGEVSRNTAAVTSTRTIRTGPSGHCALCGRLGEPLYTDLQDRLFGVDGRWHLSRCSDPQCGLVWLDPMPVTEDIGHAYESYYTHTAAEHAGAKSLPARVYRAVKRSYLASRYGYCTTADSRAGSCLGWLLYLFPIRRSGVDDEVRRLRACPGGRLLDVGCGSGEWLAKMRDLGWQVSGLDFDTQAVAVATRRGLQVTQGPLEAQRYPDESFDAITLNHVIEHVPDPVATLAECRRILKRGGQLMLFTPNSASLGHLLFKKSWRGLEPPRHLHLFCPNSMRAGLSRAGFSHFDVRTVNSRYLWRYSVRLWAHRAEPGHRMPLRLKVAPQLLATVEQAMLVIRPDVGECLAVRAVKP